MKCISPKKVAVIGAGLAGSEAALTLANRGIDVVLYEMRPHIMTPAHKTDLPAELVCSNSFKSDEISSAHGILKAELNLLKSPLLKAAKRTKIPAGSALAVDRVGFSRCVYKMLHSYPNITFKTVEVKKPPNDCDYCLITAGPLITRPLTDWLTQPDSSDTLYFYDAIAPIISSDSIDMNIAFLASRWDKQTADYCNCPFTEEQYTIFYESLILADKLKSHHFENEKYFEACLPVEVVASRGFLSLPFGIMKPVGLIDPRTSKRPFAVCQLRKENAEGESYNMVGFQTRMTYGEQDRVLRLIPGLNKAEFLRYGSIHRNTYINSPKLLSPDLSLKKNKNIFIAGQLCGNEGYTESIATGHLAALFIWARINNICFSPLLSTTACGALLHHITQSEEKGFTPTNVNFGLFSPIQLHNKIKISKKDKRELIAHRASADIEKWVKENL